MTNCVFTKDQLYKMLEIALAEDAHVEVEQVTAGGIGCTTKIRSTKTQVTSDKVIIETGPWKDITDYDTW